MIQPATSDPATDVFPPPDFDTQALLKSLDTLFAGGGAAELAPVLLSLRAEVDDKTPVLNAAGATDDSSWAWVSLLAGLWAVRPTRRNRAEEEDPRS